MPSRNQFENIHDCIQKNFHSYKFNIKSLCENQKISRVTLHRIIKSNTGKSTTNYINEVRLNEAFSLLKKSDRSIKEIASNVGYFDPQYFTRLFKKKFGFPPSQIKIKG